MSARAGDDRAHGRESHTSALPRAREPRLEPKLLRFLGPRSNNERRLICRDNDDDDDDAVIATRRQLVHIDENRDLVDKASSRDIELPLSPL